jgi:diguanylate cyclase (GGDEF)-like protein
VFELSPKQMQWSFVKRYPEMDTSFNNQAGYNETVPVLPETGARRVLYLLAANVLVGSVYWGVSVLVRWYFSRYQMWPAPIWFPAGVSMFAAFSIGPWSWPGIFAGSLLTNMVSFRESFFLGALVAFGNSIAPIVSVSLMRGKIQSKNPFTQMTHVYFFGISAVAHGIISGAIGATAYWRELGEPVGAWLPRWYGWALSDTGASVLLVPFFLLIQHNLVSLQRVRKHSREFVITLAATMATVVYLLRGSSGSPAADAGTSFLILLPLLWMSVRFSVRIAYPMFVAVMGLVIGVTLAGYGPYAGVEKGGTFVIFAQMAIGFGVAVLLLGAASEEQRSAERALRKLNRDLESIVETRTAELRESKRQLEQAAFHDSLTGLPNRRLLEDRFAACRSAAARKGTPMAFLLVDLDLFKKVNDDFGHDAGDIVLVETARRLSAGVRGCDLVARLGGDEFAVLLPEIGHKRHIDSICARIIQDLSEPSSYHGNQIAISASIGVALYPEDGESWPLVYKAADQALYRAKKSGHGRWQWHRRDEVIVPATAD